jgi:hypothetical protein
MSIPELTEEGFLPPGIHDCAITELQSRFGQFQGSDHRCNLFEKFKTFVSALFEARLASSLIVDGSFVTRVEKPGDIDLVVVLVPTHDFGRELKPFEYNLLSRKRVGIRFGFDVFVTPEDSPAFHESVAFFQQVKGSPQISKGVLRLRP